MRILFFVVLLALAATFTAATTWEITEDGMYEVEDVRAQPMVAAAADEKVYSSAEDMIFAELGSSIQNWAETDAELESETLLAGEADADSALAADAEADEAAETEDSEVAEYQREVSAAREELEREENDHSLLQGSLRARVNKAKNGDRHRVSLARHARRGGAWSAAKQIARWNRLDRPVQPDGTLRCSCKFVPIDKE